MEKGRNPHLYHARKAPLCREGDGKLALAWLTGTFALPAVPVFGDG